MLQRILVCFHTLPNKSTVQAMSILPPTGNLEPQWRDDTDHRQNLVPTDASLTGKYTDPTSVKSQQGGGNLASEVGQRTGRPVGGFVPWVGGSVCGLGHRAACQFTGPQKTRQQGKYCILTSPDLTCLYLSVMHDQGLCCQLGRQPPPPAAPGQKQPQQHIWAAR